PGNIDRETVKFDHFGGFEDDTDPDRRKTKSEIMAEVIAKSKFHKHERQKLNEEVLQLGEEVDADLDGLKALLMGGAEKKKEEAKADRAWRKPLPRQEDDYDNFLRELKGEAKAAPTNRLKTEEEKAFEEKEKLEKMETERLERMQGPTKTRKKRTAQADDLDDAFGFASTLPVKKARARGRGAKAADAEADDDSDDMDEDDDPRGRNAQPLTYNNEGMLVNKEVFMMKRRPKKGAEAEMSDDGEDDDEESGEEDEDDEEEGDDDEEESGEESDAEDLEEDEMAVDGEEAEAVEMEESDEEEEELDEAEIARIEKQKAEASATIPYTFVAPVEHVDLLKYVDHLSPADQATVIHRIRVLYHAKLGGLNRSKLETLLRLMFEHVQYLARKTPADMDTINALAKHVHELCVQFPQIAAEICLRRVKKLHASIQSAGDKSSAFPWIDDLVLLKTIGTVFSVSDFDHVVGTRAQLLMAEYLMMCPVTNGRQALSGLMICQILREYVKTSKRYIPEVIHFLSNLLDALHADQKSLTITNMATCPMDLDLATLLARRATKKAEPLAAFKTDAFRVALLATTVNVVGQFSRVYSDASGFIDIYTPLLEKMERFSLSSKKKAAVSESVLKAFKINMDLVRGLLASAALKRKPLLLQKRKAMAIPTFVPKFQEHYSMDRRFDANRDHAKLKKDEAEYKKEFKGAMRELRKDSKFVARQRIEDRKEKDVVYKKKMDRIMGDLANLEGAMRGYERMNGKK
ncbi:nucleolar complex protein 14, partial [Podochytrium sp. JEL0797]